jgi:hypothetical protein
VAYSRISWPPWLERVLNVVHSALQFVGQHDGRRYRRRPHCRGCARSWRETQAKGCFKASDVVNCESCPTRYEPGAGLVGIGAFTALMRKRTAAPKFPHPPRGA